MGFIRFFYLTLVALLMASCNIDSLFEENVSGGGQSGESDQEDIRPSGDALKDFRFCRVTWDEEKQMERLSQWRDSLTLASNDDRVEVSPGDTQIDWGQVAGVDYELVRYEESALDMRLVTVPEDAALKSLSITSSRPDLLEVARGSSHYDFRLIPKGVGSVTLVVKTDDGNRTISKKYKVNVMGTVGVKVYVDRFWKNPSLTSIRYRCTGLPANMESLVLNIRDSLAVDAECRWKDVENGIYDEQVKEMTYEFAGESRDRVFRKDVRCMLRDFDESLDHFSKQYLYGTDFVGDTDEISDVKYDYYPVRMRLFLDICSSSPYVAFDVVIKGNEYVYEDEEFEDFSDDGDENDRDVLDYFELGFCERLSQSDIDAEMKRMQENLSGLGTSEEKKEWLDEIFSGMTPEEIEQMIEQLKRDRDGRY